MKRIVLSILAVAAAGGLASAQVTLTDSQDVTTNVAVVNEFAITSAAGTVVLGVNEPAVTTVLTYSTNDGFTYDISASALAWTSTQAATSFPVLTADGKTLIDSGNALTTASLALGITNVDGATTNVPLAVTGGFLLAGDYATTVTYTFE